jgi:hypothetical protein
MVIEMISHHYVELQTAIRHTRHCLFSNRQIAFESKIVILCQGKKEKKMKKRMNYPE